MKLFRPANFAGDEHLAAPSASSDGGRVHATRIVHTVTRSQSLEIILSPRQVAKLILDKFEVKWKYEY